MQKKVFLTELSLNSICLLLRFCLGSFAFNPVSQRKVRQVYKILLNYTTDTTWYTWDYSEILKYSDNNISAWSISIVLLHGEMGLIFLAGPQQQCQLYNCECL